MKTYVRPGQPPETTSCGERAKAVSSDPATFLPEFTRGNELVSVHGTACTMAETRAQRS